MDKKTPIEIINDDKPLSFVDDELERLRGIEDPKKAAREIDKYLNEHLVQVFRENKFSENFENADKALNNELRLVIKGTSDGIRPESKLEELIKNRKDAAALLEEYNYAKQRGEQLERLSRRPDKWVEGMPAPKGHQGGKRKNTTRKSKIQHKKSHHKKSKTHRKRNNKKTHRKY